MNVLQSLSPSAYSVRGVGLVVPEIHSQASGGKRETLVRGGLLGRVMLEASAQYKKQYVAPSFSDSAAYEQLTVFGCLKAAYCFRLRVQLTAIRLDARGFVSCMCSLL